MKYFFTGSFFLGVYFFPLYAISQNNMWQLKKEAKGITIYTREVTGSNIKEFKATTTIMATKEALVDVLMDVENYPEWIEDISSAKKLFYRADSLGMYYQMNLPWPIKDRDLAMISHLKSNTDNSTLISIKGATNLVEEKEDFIRIKKVKGQWHVNPIEGNKCEVTYNFLADPEGFLPAWVVNIFIVDGPFKTLQNLKEYVKQ